MPCVAEKHNLKFISVPALVSVTCVLNLFRMFFGFCRMM